jgi:hypothetical protein
MNGLSHASTSKNKTPYVDYCILKCSYQSLKNPELLIKSQWIRPEDLHYYEDLGYFDFKLLERNAPTSVLVKRVKAYSTRKSPKNLMELIQPFGFGEATKKEFGWLIKYFSSLLFEMPFRIRFLRKLLKKRGMLYAIKENPMVLDSHKIPPDFLDALQGHSCSQYDNCSSCDYCPSIAKAAYSVDNNYREECLELYDKVFDELISR